MFVHLISFASPHSFTDNHGTTTKPNKGTAQSGIYPLLKAFRQKLSATGLWYD